MDELGEDIGRLRMEAAVLKRKMTGLTLKMDSVEPTVAKHFTELMKFKDRMDQMEAGEGIHTTEICDRQTRDGTFEGGSRLVPITLAGWVNDWND